MLGNDYGLALRLDKPQMLPQLADCRHIQIGRRLVEQIDLRAHGIDRGKGNFLLLPSGESEDIAAEQVFDVQRLGCFCHTPHHLLLRDGLIFHTEGNLTVGVHIKKLRPGILEHAAHLLRNAVHGQLGKVFAVKQNLSAQLAHEELRDQTVYQPGESSLSAAGAPAEQDALSVRNGEVNMLQPSVRAVRIGKGHILKFDHTPTAFHTISPVRNAANRTSTRKSAACIRMLIRQVRGFGFSMPLVTEAMESSSAALLAAVKSGT